tara:strand:- start:8345 stop:8722 length:378 start_codon:yes stop_codon:yes gene_type:complete
MYKGWEEILGEDSYQHISSGGPDVKAPGREMSDFFSFSQKRRESLRAKQRVFIFQPRDVFSYGLFFQLAEDEHMAELLANKASKVPLVFVCGLAELDKKCREALSINAINKRLEGGEKNERRVLE